MAGCHPVRWGDAHSMVWPIDSRGAVPVSLWQLCLDSSRPSGSYGLAAKCNPRIISQWQLFTVTVSCSVL